MGGIHCYSLHQTFENIKLKDYANLFVAPPGFLSKISSVNTEKREVICGFAQILEGYLGPCLCV